MAIDEVRFSATIPLLQSAWQIAGDGGARIKLDIPESHLMQALPMLAWRGMELEIVVRPAQINKAEMGHGTKQHDNQARRGAKSRWQAPEEPGLDGDSGAGRQ